MKKLLFTLVFLLFPLFVHAQESIIQVSPAIIDEQAKAGDIFKYKINIKNLSDSRKANIYAAVNDITLEEGGQVFANPGDLDNQTSMAKWIKFKRGVIELMPGESTQVDLEINVSSTALPGKRYARIALPIGSNKGIAHGSMRETSYTEIMLSFNIVENVFEKAQLVGFNSLSNAYMDGPARFSYTVHNAGNRDISPKGAIYIYNRRGEEVASVPINEETSFVSSGEDWEEIVEWAGATKLGKYKARLEIEYGASGLRDLQDTVYFWVMPWKILLGLFGFMFLILSFLIILIFRKTYSYHHHEAEGGHHVVRAKNEAENNGVLNLKE
ncbi:hypothetical protein C0583_05105 [Candidatus Parcubacteria bacterium]|nr:MAG: hypothetical protein C0583_05105 [Candidatus Parcubacteria bacterium]